MPVTHIRASAVALVCLIGGVLLPEFTQAAGDGDYLQQIEQETWRQATLPTVTAIPAATSPARGSNVLVTQERLPLGLQQEGFEDVLRSELVGTYAFFQKLPPHSQRQVFETYQQDNRVRTIRDTILKLLGNVR